jgi:hypothetical protein
MSIESAKSLTEAEIDPQEPVTNVRNSDAQRFGRGVSSIH